MWLLPQIFVRAFDSDERLVGVAFMDVGVYVTSLQTLKNLLLIGDAVKSVSFVAFQVCSTASGFEHGSTDLFGYYRRTRTSLCYFRGILIVFALPAQISYLPKRIYGLWQVMRRASCVFMSIIRKVNFFVATSWSTLIISSILKSLVILDPDSRDGRHLLLRTEFHCQRECRTTVTVIHRTKEDPPIPNSRILAGVWNQQYQIHFSFWWMVC